MGRRLVLLHEDDWLVVVNKPAGISVHRGWDRERDVVMFWLRDQLGRWVYPVHRLDRPTSGVLLFAFSSEGACRLQTLFSERRIQKRYIGLVRGVWQESCLLEHAIPSKPKGPRVPAVTEFTPLHVLERYSVIAARPVTGRLHQIRRHCKHLSHPMIGDVRYGKGKHNRYFREMFGLHRLALHALESCWVHPWTGKTMHIVAPPPSDLTEPLEQAGVPTTVWEPCLLDLPPLRWKAEKPSEE